MMHRRHNNSWFAMGIAFLGWLLAAANVNAQPRRDRRNNQVAQQQALAQTAQPAPQQCTPDDANVARQHRRIGADAFDAHDWLTCSAEYQVAQARCPTAEAAFNLATCLENQGILPQALEQYEALQRGGQLPAEVSAQQLQRLIDNVRSRLPRTTAPVVTPVATPARTCVANLQIDPSNCGVCGNRCNGSETCTAGRCQPIVGGRQPVTTPVPRRSHLVPALLTGTGGALAITGIVMGVVGNNAASTLCEVERVSGCNRLESGMDPRTFATLGWITAGVGGAVAIAGLVLEVMPSRSPTRPTASLTADGFSLGLRHSF